MDLNASKNLRSWKYWKQPILRTSHPGSHSSKPVHWTAILAATQSNQSTGQPSWQPLNQNHLRRPSGAPGTSGPRQPAATPRYQLQGILGTRYNRQNPYSVNTVWGTICLKAPRGIDVKDFILRYKSQSFSIICCRIVIGFPSE